MVSIDFQDSLPIPYALDLPTRYLVRYRQSTAVSLVPVRFASEMAHRHGLHALTVLLGMTTAQLPRSRPGTLTPAARQMIASVRGVTPGARGPDPIIDRIDRATKAELESCKAWASKGDLPQKGCPINAFYSAVAPQHAGAPSQRHASRPRLLYSPRGGDCRAMRYAAAQPKPSARRARPEADSNSPQVHLCAFIARLQRGGELPRDAGAVAAANLALIDVGAAFGGELVVGGLLGFGGGLRATSRRMGAALGYLGRTNRTKIVRRGRGTKKSTGDASSALPDAGQRGESHEAA